MNIAAVPAMLLAPALGQAPSRIGSGVGEWGCWWWTCSPKGAIAIRIMGWLLVNP